MSKPEQLIEVIISAVSEKTHTQEYDDLLEEYDYNFCFQDDGFGWQREVIELQILEEGLFELLSKFKDRLIVNTDEDNKYIDIMIYDD